MKEILNFMPCHRLPERSLFVRGVQFPLCFRCMGILIGMLLGAPIIWMFCPGLVFNHLIYGGLLIIPLLVDGFTQLWKWRKSTNLLRLLTGMLCGTGLSVFIIVSSRLGVKVIMMMTGS
ncbi:DUF2085 domain-containing protein (plasmid) [Cytobacillus spongiae]|uniref:DUF2085 domain-containing protein n=1 Tax=Cytobacillus spongiae TaxID=2901381 RepID=UPI00145D267B|nr:DUF2085 domain-containing protein [Cytobacillus spongiae]MCA1063043.1 DUF2085 domain-containing protein [Rossellomorea aquimaris]NMH70375.1 DUF2085 domain-containing protein [Bacillus sp. RO3]UII58635.1 DUF2085 domain-containing protein [Cytobacillus spongiae]WJV28337.1 DUF2085 domain-containing protein [Rossellomorea sp. AcN35-11]